MSKYQESLDRLATIRLDLIEDGETKLKQSIYGIHDNADLEMTGDLQTLQELVDKETPIKPDYDKFYAMDRGFIKEYYCPKCRHEKVFVNRFEDKYCHNCGQKLDWSDK